MKECHWNELMSFRQEIMRFNQHCDQIHRASWRRVFRRTDLILDVGANVGQSYDRFRELGYQGRINSYEPHPPSFRALCRFSGHHWRRYCMALSSSSGSRKFYRSLLFPYSQLNSFQYSPELGTEAVMMPARRLDSLRFGGDRIFLKIDTEGHDLEVFRGAKGILDRVRYVMMEVAVVSRYQGEPEFATVVGELAQAGFKVVMVTKCFFYHKTFECQAMDVLFKRRT